MVRSRNWPDLWWQISKIRDIQVVGIYDLMKRWRFETNRISSVATAQPQSQKPVFDFDLTWWPDLWWPGAEIFTQGVKFNREQVLKKWRRCASPFFRYPRKTGGVGIFCSPPPVRVLTRHRLGGGSDPTPPRFFWNNFFIYYCIDMKLGRPLRASIWRRLVQRKSKSAENFLL